MAAPIEVAAHRREHLEPRGPVLVLEVEILSPITARGDLVQTTSEFDA